MVSEQRKTEERREMGFFGFGSPKNGTSGLSRTKLAALYSAPQNRFKIAVQLNYNCLAAF